MPAVRTEVTEIVTGLAMLGFADLEQALDVRPASVHNVGPEVYERLISARRAGEHDDEFETAWANGVVFARAEDGLRGRPPWRIEWKGPQRPPGYEQLPADLRVDHVYLISCKYGSDILHNVSPTHLFDWLLVDRPAGRGGDWYLEVVPEAYQQFYAECRQALGRTGLPTRVAALEPEHRKRLKAELRGRWPGELGEAYHWLAVAVAQATAERWKANLPTPRRREEMLWRLVRLQAAPYFVLGASARGQPLRHRVGTPWDWRAGYKLRSFDVWPEPAGQPLVRWRADVRDTGSGADLVVAGHVEIRWSHGRFAQVPEAKVYLDTPHAEVPGYFALR